MSFVFAAGNANSNPAPRKPRPGIGTGRKSAGTPKPATKKHGRVLGKPYGRVLGKPVVRDWKGI